jgi:hypothetical protein
VTLRPEPSTEAPSARRCPLCGGNVPNEHDHCAGACPFAKNCRILCCPSCGYEFVEDSAVVRGVTRWVRWFRRKSA